MYQLPPFSDAEIINGIINVNYQILKGIEVYFKNRIKKMTWKNGTRKAILQERTDAVYTETFVRVRNKLLDGKYRDEGNFNGFFMKIAEFVDIEFFRKMIKDQEKWDKRWKDQPLPDQPLTNTLDNLPQPEPTPNELDEILENCMAKLSDSDRDLLQRFYKEEKSLKDIAENSGKSHGSLKAKVCRARKKLKKLYEEEKKKYGGQ